MGFVGRQAALAALDNIGHFVGLLSPDDIVVLAVRRTG